MLQESKPAAASLLEPEFLRRLERAAVVSRRVKAGKTRGERRSPRRGASVEFADFRSYTQGDDLRYVDWNAYARLSRMFVKLFVEEEDLTVSLLLDGSQSMDFGSPNKFRWASRICAALGYLALSSTDRMQAFCRVGNETRRTRLLRGSPTATEAFAWLAELRPSGETNLPALVNGLLATTSSPGVVFLISDLLTEGWEPALAKLAAARCETCVLQVMSPEEYSPGFQGDLRLVDSETRSARELTMGAGVMRRYVQAREAFFEAVRRACLRYGFAYLLRLTSDPEQDVVLRDLRRLQVIR